MKHAQGVFDDYILVANSAAITGSFAGTGDPINAGIRAYFDMVNAAGGIDGRMIRFLHQDDGYDAEAAQKIFREFCYDRHIFAYVGHFGAPVVAQTLSEMRGCGIPVVYFGTGIGELYVEHAGDFAQGANCYPIQPIYITEGRIMTATAVSELDAKRIGVLYTSNKIGKELFSGIDKEAAYLNISLVSQEIDMDKKNYEEQIHDLKEKNPDIVLIAAAQESFPEIVQAMCRQEFFCPVLTTYVNAVVTTALQILPAVTGKFEVYATGWLDYGEEHSEELELAAQWLGDYAMNGYAHCGWIGAHFFCEGLRRLRGKEVTWESFREAMESAPIRIPFGGMVDYAKGQRIGTQEMSLYRLDPMSPACWTEIRGLHSFCHES